MPTRFIEEQVLPELCGVNGHGARLAVSVEQEHLTSTHLGQVNREVEGSNDSVISIGDCVLDVIRRGVNEDAGIVPRSRLDPGVLVDEAKQFQLLVANVNGMLRQQGNSGHVS